ncbi:MAG: hypothetical protein IJ330_02685, partial [Oscillospiraceae bacterium]|nr:hypothetical protein [Oscillospiraceae bacterium]
MSKVLIFTEKPDVALKIASNGISLFGEFSLNGKVLSPSYVSANSDALKKAVKAKGWLENDDYIIGFAEGHLLTLFQASDYNPDYKFWDKIPSGFVPEKFLFKPAESRKYLLDNLVTLMNRKDVSKIINAGDGDREGESIFRLIYEYAKCKKPVERLWISSQTKEGLEKAFKKSLKSGSEYDSLWNAGKSRIEADFILGALLTAKTSVVIPSEKGKFKSVGRVQTPVLAEIVRVELLNRNFKTQKFHVVKGEFSTDKNEIYQGEHETRFETELEAKNFIKSITNKKAFVSSYEENTSKVYSPSLYTQTTLAIDMGSLYSMKPDTVLETAQFLYENGYTTYPRTESKHISKGDFEDFKHAYNLLSQQFGITGGDPDKNYTRIVNDADVESHPAITATTVIPNLDTLTDNQKKVYLAIVNRMFAVSYPPAVEKKQKIVTKVDN